MAICVIIYVKRGLHFAKVFWNKSVPGKGWKREGSEGVHLLTGLSNATPEYLELTLSLLFVLRVLWNRKLKRTYTFSDTSVTSVSLLRASSLSWSKTSRATVACSSMVQGISAQPIDYVFASNKSRVHRSISASCYEQTTKICVYYYIRICHIF